ncbi:MAG: hypothetical protein ACREQR_05935 [Candidatus Binataceae bacterium]
MKIGKSALTVMSAMLFAGAMALPAIAGHPFRNTDEFMSNNPAIASELQNNPKLVDDPAYVRSHPELHKYLHNHPQARADFRAHPKHFVHKENKYERRHN